MKKLLIYGWSTKYGRENWRVRIYPLAGYPVMKMVAKEESGFMMYVKESLKVNSSVF